MRLWEFQNGKMGLYSSKIDQDRAKNIKRKILKNNSFCLEIMFFLTKNCHISKFSKFYVLQFLLYLGQFLDFIGPFYHFGILKIWSSSVCILISTIVSNIVTMFEKPSLIFLHKTLRSTNNNVKTLIKEPQKCL